MRLRLTARRIAGHAVDLTVTADATATVADIAESLARADTQLAPASVAAPLTLRVEPPDGGTPQVLVRGANAGEAGLQPGSVISLVPASDRFVTEARNGVAVLRVLTGPDAGLEIPLSPGVYVVGRAASCDIVLADAYASKRHARLIVSDVVEVVDNSSANGVYVGDEDVERAVLGPADTLLIGETHLQVETLPGAAKEPRRGSSVPYNRSPLVRVKHEGQPFDAPRPPDRARPNRFPLIALFAPVIMGVSMYAFTKNPMSLMFVALTPMMLIGNFFESRQGERRRVREATVTFDRDLDRLREEILEGLVVEHQGRNSEVFTTAELVGAAMHLRPPLWTRRPEHDDLGHVMLGTGRQPARCTVNLPDRGDALPEHWSRLKEVEALAREIDDVPVTADLLGCGALGVAGPRTLAEAAARAFVAQLVTLHSPAELVLTLVSSNATGPTWDWVKWLPHVESPHSPLRGPHLASSPAAASSLTSQVDGLVEDRQAAIKDNRTRELPLVVLIVEDDAPVERGRLVSIAERGPAVGVHVIWVSERPDLLPAACRTFIVLESGGALTAGFVQDGTYVKLDSCEQLDAATAHNFARRLAPVTDAGAPTLDESDLPRSVGYLTLVGEEVAHDPTAVVARWRENGSLLDRTAPPTRRRHDANLRGVIGQGTEQAFALDLRTQGPHALVGGTTGAGKSEFLQAWVLGMAAAHSPDRVTFLFVDYKGGAAFADCVKLPHTVGLVTDLSPHLVRRALTSLRAELHHREHLLNRKKAKDLLALERTGDHETPPALIIVVDEFAALVSEVPEFVDGVVDVAQRGRSLGLHLVLATQRPAGVIKDNLRANTNLRVALRMADESDSADVLGDPMAGGFDPAIPGRGAVRTGPGKIAMFQTGYAGGRSSSVPPRPRIDIESLLVGPGQPWEVPLPFDHVEEAPEDGPTDIARAVETIARAARLADVPAPRKPWLAELRDVYDLAKLPQSPTALALGVVDEPARQVQRPFCFHPDAAGHLAVFGAGGSGRSGALRTVAVAAVLAGEPAEIYGIDAGAGGLAMLAPLPQLGAVIDGTDGERVKRLLVRLGSVLDERAAAFAAARAGTLTEYCELTGTTEPRIWLLVDGFSAFRETYESSMATAATWGLFTRLLAEGRPLGVHVVLSADRPGALGTAVTSSIQQRLVLRQADEGGYMALDVPKDILGPASPCGRAVLAGTVDEMQVAVIGGSGRPADQAATIEALAAAERERGGFEAPAVERLSAMIPAASMPDRVEGMPVLGVWDETLEPLPFEPRGVFVLAGMPGSGRSSALVWLATSLRRWSEDVRMSYVGPSRSRVRQLHVWDDVAVTIEEIQALARTLRDIVAVPADDEPEVVLVIEGLSDYLGGDVEGQLTELIKAARRNGHLVIAEGETTAWGSSWPLVTEVRNGRRGFVLQPDQSDGEALFRTPFPRMARADFAEGRGEYVAGGRLRRVQMPLVTDL